MISYLSPAWIAAADNAVRAALSPSPEHLVLAYVVDDVPDVGRVEYSVVFGPDGARIDPGRPSSSDVTFSLDHEAAAAIADGRLERATRLHRRATQTVG